MKTKVQIEDKLNFGLPLKRKVAKIVNLLFEIEDIREKSAIKGLGVECLSFGIVLVDDDEIRSINKNYRNKNEPTDVISFALFADDDNKFVFNKTAELGEIIISLETAKKQAAGQDLKSFKTEIYTLICHGILHILGFDHLNDVDYNFVVGIQNSVISRL